MPVLSKEKYKEVQEAKRSGGLEEASRVALNKPSVKIISSRKMTPEEIKSNIENQISSDTKISQGMKQGLANAYNKQYNKQKAKEEELRIAKELDKERKFGVNTKKGIVVYEEKTIKPKTPKQKLLMVTNPRYTKSQQAFGVVETIERKDTIERKSTITPKDSLKESLRKEVGEKKLQSRKLYGEYFERKPSYSKLTPRKVLAETSSAVLISTSRNVKYATTQALRKVGYEGIKTDIPKKKLYQRGTIGGEMEITGGSYVSLKPETIGKSVEFGYDVGAWTIIPSPILAIAGGSILTAPKSTGITTGERITGGIMTLPLFGKALKRVAYNPIKNLVKERVYIPKSGYERKSMVSKILSGTKKNIIDPLKESNQISKGIKALKPVKGIYKKGVVKLKGVSKYLDDEIMKKYEISSVSYSNINKIGKTVKPKKPLFQMFRESEKFDLLQTIKKREPVSKSLDSIQSFVKGNDALELSRFILETKIPPQKAIVTTRLRNILNLKPKRIIDITKGKKYLSFNVEPIVSKGGVLAPRSYFFTTRVGKKIPSYYTLYSIEGQTVKKGGYDFGTAVVTKIGRLKPKSNTLDLAKLGRTKTRFETITVSKNLNPEGSEVEALFTATGIRDITKPFARVKKKAPVITGITFKPKPIDLTPSESYIIPKSINTITKTETKSADAIGLLKQASLKTLPKQNRLTKVPKKITQQLSSQELAPKMVGGYGKGVSIYYGKGVANDERFIVQDNYLGKVEKKLPKSSSLIKTTTISSTKSLLIPKIGLDNKQNYNQQPRLLIKEKQSLLEDTALKQTQKTSLKSNLKTMQDTALKQTTITPRYIPSYTPKPITPISPPIPPPTLLFPFKKKNKRLFTLEKTYNVFVKRKGKFKPIATNLTKGKAGELLSKRLLREITRTGKIKPTGRKKEVFSKDSYFQPNPRTFRTYKIKKGKKIQLKDTFIQKTSANLKSRQEKFELAEARRLKKLVGT